MNFKDILRDELQINEMANVTKGYQKAKHPEDSDEYKAEIEAADALVKLIKDGKFKEAAKSYRTTSGKKLAKAVPGIVGSKLSKNETDSFRNILKGDLSTTIKKESILNPKKAKEIAEKGKVKAMGPGGAKSDGGKGYGVASLGSIQRVIGTLYQQYEQELRWIDKEFTTDAMNMTKQAKAAKDLKGIERRKKFLKDHEEALEKVKELLDKKGKFKSINDDEFKKLSKEQKTEYMKAKGQAAELADAEQKLIDRYSLKKKEKISKPRVDASKAAEAWENRQEEAEGLRKTIKSFNNAEDVTKIDLMKIKATLKEIIKETPSAKEYTNSLNATKRDFANQIKVSKLTGSNLQILKDKLEDQMIIYTKQVKRNVKLISSSLDIYKNAVAKAEEVIEKADGNELDTDGVEEVFEIISDYTFEETKEKKGNNQLLEDIIGYSGITK